MIPTFLGITIVGFFIINMAPGGPIEQAMLELRFSMTDGGASNIQSQGQTGVTEEIKEALKIQFGFDKPIHIRYLLWLQNILTLNFGESLILDEYVSVVDLVVEKFPISLRFGIFSFVITYLICIPLGVAKALKDGSSFDFFSSLVVFAGYAMPPILMAVLLITLFGGGTYWDLLPISGLHSENYGQLSFFGKVVDEFRHMVMPMTCYVMGNFAAVTLLMKNSVIEEIRKEYIITAKAKGLKPRVVYFKHALRNALIPVATGFSAIISLFLSGSLLIEQIFSLDGIGRLGYSAVIARDYPVVLGLLAISGVVLLLSKLLTDLIYMAIDPRVSFEKSTQGLSLPKRGGLTALLGIFKALWGLLKLPWLSLKWLFTTRWWKIEWHPNTLARIQRFKKRKTAWYSMWFILITFGLSLIGEVLINDDPIVVVYDGEVYFPLFKRYSPEDFGLKYTFVVDYYQLREKDEKVDMMVFAYPFGPLTIHQELAPPSTKHWLGTDQLGRDLLARLVFGYRNSMIYALSVWVFAFILGTLLGGMQGYFGGRIDFSMQRLTEIWSSMPTLFLLIILIAVFQGNTLFMLVVLTVLFEWVGISYYMRAEFLRLRKLQFVQAGMAYGASHFSLMFKHILPNAIIPLITFTPFAISSNITGIATLDFLGLGLSAPAPSWGELMKQALDNFSIAPWIPASIIGAMFITLLALVFVNEGVRDAFDPKK